MQGGRVSVQAEIVPTDADIEQAKEPITAQINFKKTVTRMTIKQLSQAQRMRLVYEPDRPYVAEATINGSCGVVQGATVTNWEHYAGDNYLQSGQVIANPTNTSNASGIVRNAFHTNDQKGLLSVKIHVQGVNVTTPVISDWTQSAVFQEWQLTSLEPVGQHRIDRPNETVTLRVSAKTVESYGFPSVPAANVPLVISARRNRMIINLDWLGGRRVPNPSTKSDGTFDITVRRSSTADGNDAGDHVDVRLKGSGWLVGPVASHQEYYIHVY